LIRPASVRWFDADYPEVIALRRRLYPEHAGYRMIGSSVTDTQWIDQVPADGPAMIIAEGLFMYLREDEIRKLFSTLTTRLPGGELAFDVNSRLGLRLVQSNRMVRATGAQLHWSMEDPRELEAIVPRLKLVAEQITYDPAQKAQFSGFSLPARLAIRIMYAITAFRRIGRLLRYKF
jgi:O-methyltransferase involved in polyketide biosynthesis